MLRIFFSLFFYFRRMNGEVTKVCQMYFKHHIGNDRYEFFEIYFTNIFNFLLIFSKQQNSIAEVDSAKADFDSGMIEVRVNSSFSNTSQLKCTEIQAGTILLNMLKSFPQGSILDNLNNSTIKDIASFVENYIKMIRDAFEKKSFALTCDNFEPSCLLQLKNILFLTQNQIRLFMLRSDFRYCASSLIATLLSVAQDKVYYCRFLTRFLSEMLRCAPNGLEDDRDCVKRLILPLVQLGFECWGLIYTDTIIDVSEAYVRQLKKSRNAVNELTYSFINLMKFNYFPGINKVV